MGLKNLTLPTTEIEVHGAGTFRVRGLSFSDLRSLLSKYSTEIQMVFNLVSSKKTEDINEADRSALLMTVIDNAPMLAADVIAYASDDQDALAEAMTLPFPVQLEALSAIAKLTFTSEQSVKKFTSTVEAMFAKPVE